MLCMCAAVLLRTMGHHLLPVAEGGYDDSAMNFCRDLRLLLSLNRNFPLQEYYSEMLDVV